MIEQFPSKPTNKKETPEVKEGEVWSVKKKTKLTGAAAQALKQAQERRGMEYNNKEADAVTEGELWSVKKKTKLTGAALASATRAQNQRFEDIKARQQSKENNETESHTEESPYALTPDQKVDSQENTSDADAHNSERPPVTQSASRSQEQAQVSQEQGAEKKHSWWQGLKQAPGNFAREMGRRLTGVNIWRAWRERSEVSKDIGEQSLLLDDLLHARRDSLAQAETMRTSKDEVLAEKKYRVAQQAFKKKLDELHSKKESLTPDQRARLAHALWANRTRKEAVRSHIKESMQPWQKEANLKLAKSVGDTAILYTALGSIATGSGALVGAGLSSKIAFDASNRSIQLEKINQDPTLKKIFVDGVRETFTNAAGQGAEGSAGKAWADLASYGLGIFALESALDGNAIETSKGGSAVETTTSSPHPEDALPSEKLSIEPTEKISETPGASPDDSSTETVAIPEVETREYSPLQEYQVVKGDNLWKLWGEHAGGDLSDTQKVQMEAMVRANPEAYGIDSSNPDLIFTGETVNLQAMFEDAALEGIVADDVVPPVETIELSAEETATNNEVAPSAPDSSDTNSSPELSNTPHIDTNTTETIVYNDDGFYLHGTTAQMEGQLDNYLQDGEHLVDFEVARPYFYQVLNEGDYDTLRQNILEKYGGEDIYLHSVGIDPETGNKVVNFSNSTNGDEATFIRFDVDKGAIIAGFENQRLSLVDRVKSWFA